MLSFEIYITDLKEDVQRQLLEQLGITTPEQGNYDITPLCTINIEEEKSYIETIEN